MENVYYDYAFYATLFRFAFMVIAVVIMATALTFHPKYSSRDVTRILIIGSFALYYVAMFHDEIWAYINHV